MRYLAVAFCAFAYASATSFGAIVVSSSTVFWKAIINPGTVSDFADDNQANISDLELVGDVDNAAFYNQFDDSGTPSLTDGELAFRFRMSGNQGNRKFHGYAWVGVDVNRDGNLDLFFGASDTTIGIYEVEGGTATSPGDTGIGNEIWTTRTDRNNYEWAPVTLTNDPVATSLDIDGEAGNDYFLSFVLPFNEVVEAVNSITNTNSFEETSTLRYIAATSTNRNKLNSDINGVEGGTSSNEPWEDNNGFTEEVEIDGTPIPEPAFLSMGIGLIAFGTICLTKRHRRP